MGIFSSRWPAFAIVIFVFACSACKQHQPVTKPEENRFVKRVLTEGEFTEPTEMAILPNLDVIVVERRGQILKYDNSTKKLKQVGLLNVYFHSAKANSEEGLLGIAADPDFDSNHYLYMYYAPVGVAVDRLSRFTLEDDTIDLKSEKKILEVKTDRDICCHTGGSVAFGKNNILFVSAGDNSTPFDEPGQKYATHAFGPMDDRPGHKPYDARRSAGNTNDLRGKILRIKINSDGSYSIPDGNLFPQGKAKTRPEIYIMGDRNPYRISVDKETGNLYWGEVGPDAYVDSPSTRGSRGYDEVNQARKAGNFGWPFFVGNNYAYRQHNYETNADGYLYNPAKPVNASRNNTGLLYLPPAQPAFIWYPYANSKEFPELGSGGRTAMAGPVFNYDDYPEDTRYPEYYNHKLFIYDFMRGWIKAVSMKPNGDYDHMEAFMEHARFDGMIDMEMGPDGRIYVLEYGNGWFTGNTDAMLSRLDYLPGNRPPAVSDILVEKTSGNLPFAVKAKVKASDPEGDALTYEWTVGNFKQETKKPELNYPINYAGDYDVSVEVIDSHGASTKSNSVSVYAGNEQPKIDVSFAGDQQFYFPGRPVSYKVNVTDNGDKINPKNLYISASYINSSSLNGPALGDQMVSPAILGKNLMLSLDCKSCHKIDSVSIGPPFKNVAKRYSKNPAAMDFLPKKIIKGGSGNWGETAMAAHPSLKVADAKEIVQWILTLADTVSKAKSLATAGTLMPKADPKQPQNTVFSIDATYTDNGGPGIRALSAAKGAYLRSSLMDAGEFLNPLGFAPVNLSNQNYLSFPADTGSFNTAQLNLKTISGLEFTGFSKGKAATYKVMVLADSEHGLKTGEGVITFKGGKQAATASITIQRPADGKAHYYFVVCKQVTALKNVTDLPLLKSVRFVEGK